VIGPVRVFIACSLDGFIAGRDNDLSWLPEPEAAEDYGYQELLAQTSAILMGRATYDVAAGFADWPYAEMPVFVATRQPLDPIVPTVRPIRGTPSELLSIISASIDGGVYLDGGSLIRSFLDDDLIDELTLTIVDVILGAGIPLFAGVTRRHRLMLVNSIAYPNGLVQLRYAPSRSESPPPEPEPSA
jgi:dihydrofolate reductase